ncbi:Spindle and centriole-associated protein 1 [Holothuria leucospilota]|uniref:Spindle and centriole-associated protein 1 n=1 Tax=Holothuria leucospilota TaxID=206669 RepID=A0A9Q1HC02_HOLLE|nr:Spindle and centriole-associated protein 1 [Holothuria leucospilota]
MSFVRQNRSSQPSSSKVKQKNKSKKKVPAWDNTMSDLSVHKLTREEVERRKEVHQSKNLAAVKADRQMRALMKANRKKLLSQDDSERSSLLQEILYDEEQMRDAISHSDRVMAVVKDLFGDDPRVKSGKANVTLAPGKETGDRAPRNLPDMTLQPSHLDVLSESVMDPQALNDVSEEEADCSDDSCKENQFQGFEGSLDLERFRHYIAKESANKEHHQMPHIERKNRIVFSGGQRSSGVTEGQNLKTLCARYLKMCYGKRKNPIVFGGGQRSSGVTGGQNLGEWHSNNLSDSERDRSYVEEQSETRAINDTAKVEKKSRARTSEEKEMATQHDTDLAKVIHGIQDEVRGYEQVTGKRVLPESDGGQSSNLTVFLVQTICTLIHHLAEKEKQRENDETISALKAQLAEHRNLIDALTTEMIRTQEGLARLEAQLLQGKVSMKEDSQAHVQSQTLTGNRMTEVTTDPNRDQGKDCHEMFNKANQLLEETLEQRSKQGHPSVHQQSDHHISSYTFTERKSDMAEGAPPWNTGGPNRVENHHLNQLRHEDPLQGDQAIMLSPPRQRDRRTLFKDHGPTLAKRELFISHSHQSESSERFGINSGMAAMLNPESEHNTGSLTGDPPRGSRLDPKVPIGSAFRPSDVLKIGQMSYPSKNHIPVRDQPSLYRLDGNYNSEVSLTSKEGDLSVLPVSQSLTEGRSSDIPPNDMGSQTLFHRVDWKLKDTSLMSTDSHTSYRSLPSMQGGEQIMRGGSSMKASSEQVSSAQLTGQDSAVPVVVSEPGLITSEEGTLSAISDLNRRIAALSREHADAEERLGNLKKTQGLIYS